MSLSPAKAPRGPPSTTDHQGGQVHRSRAGMGSTPNRVLSKLCFLVESGTFLTGRGRSSCLTAGMENQDLRGHWRHFNEAARKERFFLAARGAAWGGWFGASACTHRQTAASPLAGRPCFPDRCAPRNPPFWARALRQRAGARREVTARFSLRGLASAFSF